MNSDKGFVNASALKVAAGRYVNRISLSFLYGMYLMLISGSYYAFSSYAEEVRSLLKFTQTEINTMSSLSAMTSNGCIAFGILLDRFDFRLSILIASVMTSIGYALTGLGCKQLISHHYLWMALYLGMANLGNMGAYLGSMRVNIANVTSKLEGPASGVMVALYALSAMFISLIYIGVGSVTTFMYVLSAGTGISFLLGAVAMHSPKKPGNAADSDQQAKPDDRVHVSQLSGYFETTKIWSWTLAVFALYTGTAPACILTILSTLWSQIESYGYQSSVSSSTAVMIFSVANCVGRFSFGCAYYFLSTRSYLATSNFLITLFLLALFSAKIFVDHYAFFIVFITGLGLAYGVMFTTIPIGARTYFGFKRYGVVLAISLCPVSLVSFLYLFASGQFYDHLVEPGQNSSKCVGSQCYLYTYILMMLVTLLGLLITVWFYVKERRCCQRQAQEAAA